MYVLLPAGFAPPGEVHFHADLFDSAVSSFDSMLTTKLFGQLHMQVKPSTGSCPGC